jgi:UDP-N-acetylmuramate--alanine ligase
LEIYPARELPIEGITAQWLCNQIENPNKTIVAKSDLIAQICAAQESVIVTIGAGDIGEMVKEIKEALTQKSRT